MKEMIQEILDANDRAVELAIAYVFQNQTASEKAVNGTSEANGIGFSMVDAPLLSSFAKQIQAGKTLSEKQLKLGRKLIKKYHRQLHGVVDELREAKKADPVPTKEIKVNDSTNYEIRGSKLVVATEYKDVKTRSTCKELGFKWNPDDLVWESKDDLVKRLAVNAPLPVTSTIYHAHKDIFPYLKDYQRRDVDYMVEMGNVLNANYMGLGKTLEAIVYIMANGCDHNLIVAPSTLLFNWKDELQKWFDIPDEDIVIIEGTKKQRLAKIELARTAKYVITNYETISGKVKKRQNSYVRDFFPNEYTQALQTIHWGCIVADEVHRIKNRFAARTMGLESLSKQVGQVRAGLTGTPVQNKPNDLYSILHWIDPFYTGESYWRFTERYCHITDNGWGKKIEGLTTNLEKQLELTKLLKYVSVKNSVKEVLPELPDSVETTIKVRMTAKQRKLYDKVTEEVLIQLGEDREDGVIKIPNALTRILRLQQLASNPELFDLKQNPKFDALIDLLNDTEEKVIVFSRFEQTLQSLAKRLDDAKIKHVSVTGKTENNPQSIRKFKNDPDVQVFMGTIDKVSEGLTLTESTVTVFLDKVWSPAKNDQAKARNHRIGQKNLVRVYDLVCEGSIDQWVEDVLGKKIEDIEAMLLGR